MLFPKSYLSLFCLSIFFNISTAFQASSSVTKRKFVTTTLSTVTTSSVEVETTDITGQTEVIMTSGPELPPVPKNAKRLFFIRHGEVINPGGDRSVYYGAMDVSLSQLGQQEAIVAAQYLSQYNISHVFCSPLSRAIYGAERICELQQTSQQKPIQIKGFTELDRGSWCGKTKDEIGADAMARFDACDESVTPDGGESFPTLKQRVLHARDEALATMDEYGTIGAIVSHLQVTRSILSDALNIPTNQMTNIKVATASITCIDYYNNDEENNKQVVHFQSFKPDVGLKKAKDGAN